MGTKFQIKYAHIRIQGQTFDHVLRAHGNLPICGTQVDSKDSPIEVRPYTARYSSFL